MPYKFNLEKYGNVAKEDAMKCKRIYDGRDVYVDAAGTFWCDGVRVERDMCDFIPDAPQESTFMVFDREVFAKRWPDNASDRWAVSLYGHIMEFKGNGENACNSDVYCIDRKWCRPLTLDDFKREKIAVTFKNEAEQKRFLQECEKAGMRFNSGALPTTVSYDFSFPFASKSHICTRGMTFWSAGVESAKKDGFTVVPFASFSFPSEAPKAETKPARTLGDALDAMANAAAQLGYRISERPSIPSRSIHITSDGQTTHAVYKEGGEVVKRSKATCGDFHTAAEKALERLFPLSEAFEAGVNAPSPQLYMEIKRKAKVGEKIKTKNGEIMNVTGACDRGSDTCVMCGSLHLLPFEYVVLLPIRRVHRRAKPGEWAEIKTDPRANQEFYPSGLIVRCENSDDLFSHGWLMSEDKYDVLEGYEEGAKWPEK